jgi:hypothetical protein
LSEEDNSIKNYRIIFFKTFKLESLHQTRRLK